MTVNIRKRQGKDEYDISISDFKEILIGNTFEIDNKIMSIYLNTEEIKNLKEEINKLRLK